MTVFAPVAPAAPMVATSAPMSLQPAVQPSVGDVSSLTLAGWAPMGSGGVAGFGVPSVMAVE